MPAAIVHFKASYCICNAVCHGNLSCAQQVHLRQCNIDRLEEEALAVSELDSPRYGQHLSAREVCRISSCPGRDEAVRGVLEWVLGAAALPKGFRWEEGKWLTREEGSDDVMAKARNKRFVFQSVCFDQLFPRAGVFYCTMFGFALHYLFGRPAYMRHGVPYREQ